MRRQLYVLCKRPRGSKRGERWTVIGLGPMRQQNAIRVYQSQLIANAIGQLEPDYEYRLRPVRGNR